MQALASDRLVKPFDLTLPVAFAYYAVFSETTAERSKIVAFCERLQKEAKPVGIEVEGTKGHGG